MNRIRKKLTKYDSREGDSRISHMSKKDPLHIIVDMKHLCTLIKESRRHISVRMIIESDHVVFGIIQIQTQIFPIPEPEITKKIEI